MLLADERAAQKARENQVSLIFITGYLDRAVQERAQQLNPLAYLVKPATPGDLEPWLASAVS